MGFMGSGRMPHTGCLVRSSLCNDCVVCVVLLLDDAQSISMAERPGRYKLMVTPEFLIMGAFFTGGAILIAILEYLEL